MMLFVRSAGIVIFSLLAVWRAHAQSITITSPAPSATVSGSVPLSATLASVPSTDHVEWYVHGRLYAISHSPCLPVEVGCVPGFGNVFHSQLAGDAQNTTVQAIAKDVFGTQLATSTNSFSIRNLGPILTLTGPGGNWSGDVTITVSGNLTNSDGSLDSNTCYLDGKAISSIDDGYAVHTLNVPHQSVIHTAHFPNGQHEIFCAQAHPPTAQNYEVFASTAVVGPPTTRITYNGHVFVTSQTVVLSCGGTCPGGLTSGNTYYTAYRDFDNFSLATSPADAASCAASGTNCINLTSQGTGTNTLRFSLTNPAYDPSGAYNVPYSQARLFPAFANSNAPMELHLPQGQDVYLHQDSGPSSLSLAPFVANADGTTSAIAANAAAYSSDNAAVATVSSSGVVTAAAPGFANITVTYSTLPVVTTRVGVLATTEFKHFSKSGGILSSFDPAKSNFLISPFSSDQQVDATNGTFSKAMCAEWAWSGVTVSELGMPYFFADSATTSYASVVGQWDSYFNARKADATNCAHGFYVRDDSLATIESWSMLLQNWGNWGPDTRLDALNYALDTIKNDARAMAGGHGDEVTAQLGPFAHPNFVAGGPQFTNVVLTGCPGPCSGAGTATINVPQGLHDNRVGQWIKLTNCTTANLCGAYTIVSSTATTAVVTTHNVPNGTYDQTTDPGMHVGGWGALEFCPVPGTTGGQGQFQAWDANFTQISVAANGLATFSWTGCCGTPTQLATLSTGRIVIISGSSTAALNGAYSLTRVNNNSFTIQTYGVPAGVHNSGNDAGLKLSVDCNTNDNLISDIVAQAYQRPGMAPWTMPILGALWSAPWVFADRYENDPTVTQAAHMFTSAGMGAPNYGDRASVYQILPDKLQAIVNARGHYMYPIIHIVQVQPGLWIKQTPAVSAYAFKPGVDQVQLLYSTPEYITAQMGFLLVMGASGMRPYAWQSGSEMDTEYRAGPGFNVNRNINPWDANSGPRHWAAMSLMNNFILRNMKYILQPQISAPYFGSYFYTGARQGSYGRILMVQSLSEMARQQIIDFTNFKYPGGLIRRYRVSAGTMSVVPLSSAATSDSPTFGTGEFIAYVFQPSGSQADTDAVRFPAPVSFPPGTTRMGIRINYYKNTQDSDAIECTAGCSVEMDLSGGAWYQRIYTDSGAVARRIGPPQRIRSRP